MSDLRFRAYFEALTGKPPFPWQTALYAEMASGKFSDSANIPTGLGKTSIVALWLIALGLHPGRTPRRLVYVVNRRTVVDQTTSEVLKLREALVTNSQLCDLRHSLAALCALPLPKDDAPPLAISTLRGQFADNGEWIADPARPSVVIGTVDMIGSGLLFTRYTRGFKTRPLHAGFLAQDALLVHDEAHLEPSFQSLLDRIVAAQAGADLRPLQVMQLTATSRTDPKSGAPPFGLDQNPADKDTDNPVVRTRVQAAKRLLLTGITKASGGTVVDKIIELALAKKKSLRAVLIFLRSVKDAEKVFAELKKAKQDAVPLTGTMRGKERDELVLTNAIFQRFLPDANRAADVNVPPGTVFLVATSAGEVGVNLSADDLICDLSTYDSMAQRFGRVNRFGLVADSEVTVVYRADLRASYDDGLAKAMAAKDADKKVAAYEKSNRLDQRLLRTLALLEKLRNHGSSVNSAALETLPPEERAAAFSPEPAQRIATGIQFDAWALTSIRSQIAARPPIAPYLHGEAEWQPPETYVAWRRELDVIDNAELRSLYPPTDLLEDYPLKPHELLRDTSERIFDRLVEILTERRKGNSALLDAWLVREGGEVEVFSLDRFLSDERDRADEAEAEDESDDNEVTAQVDDKKFAKTRRARLVARLANATLILPASIGGIDKGGLLTPEATAGDEGDADVADIMAEDSPCRRMRIRSATREVPAGFRLIRVIDRLLGKEHPDDADENFERYWLWLETKAAAAGESRFSANATAPETLAAHSAAVVANAAVIAAKLLPTRLGKLLVIAARLHDLGKNRAAWQRNLGSRSDLGLPDYDPSKPESILAKSAPGMRPRNLAEYYRHEFGSLSDAAQDAEFRALDGSDRDVVLHLVAAHHGRARPHFPAEEIVDYAAPDSAVALATEVPRRFARLQQRFGRWGLAWLESLLRAADYAASAGIVASPPGQPSDSFAPVDVEDRQPQPTLPPSHAGSTATLFVDPANPGHYFACCGLFELASRLDQNALAWFERDGTSGQWRFGLSNVPPLAELLDSISIAEVSVLDARDATASPLNIGSPFGIRLDWWKTAARESAALKVWAGTMECPRIARAMQAALNGALSDASFVPDHVLFHTFIAYDPNNPTKKVEPFYFDARRGPNADSRDVGFAPNDLGLETLATPAVELLTLVGLQRSSPNPTPKSPRNFDYRIWTKPLPISLLPAALSGLLPDQLGNSFRFESWFRTSQRKHKAFLTSRSVSSQ